MFQEHKLFTMTRQQMVANGIVNTEQYSYYWNILKIRIEIFELQPLFEIRNEYLHVLLDK